MKMIIKSFYWFLAFLVVSNYTFSQYSISGYLDTEEKNKKVYLSILDYNERTAISDKQIITHTYTDSTGYFSFEGKLLSDKHGLYRIHSRVEEAYGDLQKYEVDTLKNFHNFVFSNKDTIRFERNSTFWFSSNTNTNPVDKEWRAYSEYANQLQREFNEFTDVDLRSKSSTQLLAELKSYAKNRQVHPLVTLVLLGDVERTVLKEDFTENRDFYTQLQDTLNAYYEGESYAKQFNGLITDLTKIETQEDLQYYFKLTYILGAICLVLFLFVVFLIIKLRQTQRSVLLTDFKLTNQEERIGELIVQEKTNKEIATELYIALSTVKTHIRNLYAKLEVSKRKDFIDKFKNHPRD